MERLKCILLVDDDKIANTLNERLILTYQISKRVQLAENGEDALLYLSKHCSPYDCNYPDLILLDQEMPNMAGNEFLEIFEKINSNHLHKSKIVILSSSKDAELKKTLVQMGAAAFIEKPLSADKLHNVLAKNKEHA